MILKALKMSHCLISPGTDQGFQKGKPRIAVNDSQNFQYLLIIALSPVKLSTWSIMVSASRIPPTAAGIWFVPAGNTQLFCYRTFSRKSLSAERDPDEIPLATGNDVCSLCGSVVARMNLTWRGPRASSTGHWRTPAWHMRFIDDVDLITTPPGHTGHYPVHGYSWWFGLKLHRFHRHQRHFRDLDAVPTFSTGFHLQVQEIRALSDSGCTGFSYTSWTAEKECVSDPPGGLHSAGCNRFLTDQIFKPVWPQLARQYDVGHSGKK